MQHKHIVIVGGGPIGLVTALLLAKHGIPVTIIDASYNNMNDARVLALSHASMEIFAELNVWPHHLATAIKQVHISHSGFGISNINAHDVGLTDLGYTIKYTDLYMHLKAEVSKYPEIIDCKTGRVNTITPGNIYATINYQADDLEHVLTTDLAIVAEGGKIAINSVNYKVCDYKQQALIAKLSLSSTECKDGIAYERFDESGACVLLPHENQYVLVWSLPSIVADEIIQNNNLIAKLEMLPFMRRFADVNLLSKVHHFPLKLRQAIPRECEQVVLIGNAAQTIHPVSAQGMNLGLRDATTLVHLIVRHKNQFTTKEILKQFAKLRNKDSRFVIRFTDTLARFLHKPTPIMKYLRSGGILALSNCKPVQNLLTNSLIFGNT